MGSPAWLTSQIAAADAATQALGLTEDVTIEAFISQDAFGSRIPYGVAVLEPALVQRKRGELRTANGKEITFQAVISFLRPVAIDVRDRITLSDGITGPIVAPQGGLVDPTTGQPFLRTIHLG